MEICVTRFNIKTFQENENYKNNNNLIGAIYGSPTKISDKILQILVYWFRMNNSTNKIEESDLLKIKYLLMKKK